jgi:ubiquinone/menaquinone biosynthesis C-methylase UbiE
MSQHDLANAMKAEAEFFDRVADIRTADGRIPLEADMRRATRHDPKGPTDLRIDPTTAAILDRGARQLVIDALAHRPGGRVLDICCGPGWLALELGRRGQIVDAYDLSPKALAMARRMLEENPYRDGFGQVNYHLQDVMEVDLGENTYDAVSGWSAFHHLPDLDEFMKRVWRALKPGGIVATMDDMPTGRMEKALEYGTKFVLPIYTLTYAQKLSLAVRRLLGVSAFPKEVFSPMEEAKHSSVFEIANIWHRDYEVTTEFRQNAFAGTPARMLAGPDSFRYATARALVAADAVLCRLGVVHGFERIMIGRKR